MEIVVDYREKSLINNLNFLTSTFSSNISYVSLPLGDILLKHNNKEIIYIERKTLNDLLSSLKDSRFSEQSYRLSNSTNINTHSIIYLIEGDINSIVDTLQRKMVYSSISSLYYFKGFSVFRTNNVIESAELILNLAEKINKDLLKNIPSYLTIKQPIITDISFNDHNPTDYCKVVKKVKKDNIVKDNIGQIMLCQIPGISSSSAIAILKDFDNFSDFILKLRENSDFLNNIVLESNGKKRKISKKVIQNIIEFLI
jgi:ERCC4-type nuclease